MDGHFDLVVRGATVVDGSRAPRYRADVGVRGDRIAAIGPLDNHRADVEIDASGKIVSPGFIDAHTHDDRLIEKMQTMVREALDAGAIGVSTGLYYEPARAAPTEEVIEVCRPLSGRKALYCTHMRDEGEHVVDSLEETFRIGRELGVPVVVSHHKVVGLPNHGRSRETLALIAGAIDFSMDEAVTFAQPIRPAKGIEAVTVNGAITWRDGKPTGARPGRVLRRGPG